MNRRMSADNTQVLGRGIPPICVPFLTDSYKIGHWKQYRPDTQHVYSYFESREGAMFPHTLAYGLQIILDSYLAGPVVTDRSISFAREASKRHFGREDMFNEPGWQHILNKHGGHLPLRIKSVPEGTLVPNRNVIMTVENTDPEVPWLTNFIETLLVQAWYPMTVATMSMELKRIIKRYLETNGDPAGLMFKGHDFGFRGSTSVESAGIGGSAHLVNFMGTDTLRGLEYAEWFYGEAMAGFSIPASEHSTITSWGGPKFELEAFRNMLAKHPTGLVACVSDSYDIYNAITELWGRELREKVMHRDGTLVIRPDSGDPVSVILKCCDLIWARFGGRINEKGYRVFDDHVRLIQGDGIEWYQHDDLGHKVWRHTAGDILEAMALAGYSADNIAFGSGGGLLQKMDRDTLKFAFKCSAVNQGGTWRDVWKDPVTQKGKASKRGRLKLRKNSKGRLETDPIMSSPRSEDDDVMQEVFLNGQVLNRQSFRDIRERADKACGVTFQHV